MKDWIEEVEETLEEENEESWEIECLDSLGSWWNDRDLDDTYLFWVGTSQVPRQINWRTGEMG